METTSALLVAFRARTRGCIEREEETLAVLEEKVTSARASWPDIALPADRFAACLGERIELDEDAVLGLRQLRERDLYIVCAVLDEVPRALQTFERVFFARIGGFIARIDRSRTFTDEVTQALRVKLLVSPDGTRPAAGKLRQYSGRGSLDSWLCAAATRTALSLARAPRPNQAPTDELEALAASEDPELEVLRKRHSDTFRLALQHALRTLEPRQRTVLRLHVIEHAPFIKIGRIFHVHETTAMRWVALAKQTVKRQVRLILQRQLNLSQSGLDSLTHAICSQLEVSLSRLLASQ